jgi:hypothetical protein
MDDVEGRIRPALVSTRRSQEMLREKIHQVLKESGYAWSSVKEPIQLGSFNEVWHDLSIDRFVNLPMGGKAAISTLNQLAPGSYHRVLVSRVLAWNSFMRAHKRVPSKDRINHVQRAVIVCGGYGWVNLNDQRRRINSLLNTREDVAVMSLDEFVVAAGQRSL